MSATTGTTQRRPNLRRAERCFFLCLGSLIGIVVSWIALSVALYATEVSYPPSSPPQAAIQENATTPQSHVETPAPADGSEDAKNPPSLPPSGTKSTDPQAGVDLVYKLYNFFKPIQEDRDVLARYASFIDRYQVFGPILAFIFLGGLATVGYSVVNYKAAETKLEVFEKAQTELDGVNQRVSAMEGKYNEFTSETRRLSEETQTELKSAGDKFGTYISDMDKKLEQYKASLEQHAGMIRSLIDVRASMSQANIQYDLALLNWKASEFGEAIARMEGALKEYERLPSDLSELAHPTARSEAERFRKDYPFARATLAYYYAERYRKSKSEADATRARELVRDLPDDFKAVSEPVYLVDNYLFVLCSIGRIDPPLKERFRDLFDSRRESLRAHLLDTFGREKGQALYEEYQAFANSD